VRTPFLLLALGASLAAEPQFSAPPSVRTPLPFDHGAHADAFERERVRCTDCHLVGLTPTVEEPAPPLSSCHACHLAPRTRAPTSCVLCHDTGGLLPLDHDLDWLVEHAVAARARRAACSDCHDDETCRDCHDERGPLVRDPHPPGFGRTHGVAARLDPFSCSSCHAARTCDSCHRTGVRPW
jgi:hypothetical protein